MWHVTALMGSVIGIWPSERRTKGDGPRLARERSRGVAHLEWEIGRPAAEGADRPGSARLGSSSSSLLQPRFTITASVHWSVERGCKREEQAEW